MRDGFCFQLSLSEWHFVQFRISIGKTMFPNVSWFACSVCAYVWGDPEVVGNTVYTARGGLVEPRASSSFDGLWTRGKAAN